MFGIGHVVFITCSLGTVYSFFILGYFFTKQKNIWSRLGAVLFFLGTVSLAVFGFEMIKDEEVVYNTLLENVEYNRLQLESFYAEHPEYKESK